MKRRVIAFALMLAMVIAAKMAQPVIAEMAVDFETDYAVRLAYAPDRERPVMAAYTNDITADEGIPVAYKEFSFSTQYGADEIARAVVNMATVGEEKTADQWQEASDWLGGVISRAVPQTGQMDAEQMAQDIVRAVVSATTDAKRENVETANAWLKSMEVGEVRVQVPYYPELARGIHSDDVLHLQKRLIELGYLDDKADGQFGGKTEAAVKLVQTQLREREQAEIDRLYVSQPAAEPTPEPIVNEQGDDAISVMPESTPAPTPEAPPKPEPKTKVDGIAGQVFQIQLYSEALPLIDGTLDKGSPVDEVSRLQRRLMQLGCMLGAVDGDYGGNTRRGVRLFQHYNGLNVTGIADEKTQQVIFSTDAKATTYPIMVKGAEGDEVRQLQSRLITLGFMRGTPDGSFGPGTETGVRALQTYMRELEIERLRTEIRTSQSAATGIVPAQPDATALPDAQSESTADADEIPLTPTVEVTGVADPLLLDEFYAESFPAIPSAMRNGDANPNVERVQRRLGALEYIYTNPDGAFGNGTETAVRAFQERNKLPVDGIAGAQTLELLFSKDARVQIKPYILKVSIENQRVYAYGLDANEEHTVLTRTMKCSTGLNVTPTPRGTYQRSTGPGARWHYFKKFGVWAQYAYYIQGNYMFHSILYNVKGGSPNSSIYQLGRKASHGCVRLAVDDAKWIWDNCPPNTKIVVY